MNLGLKRKRTKEDIEAEILSYVKSNGGSVTKNIMRIELRLQSDYMDRILNKLQEEGKLVLIKIESLNSRNERYVQSYTIKMADNLKDVNDNSTHPINEETKTK